MLVLSCNNSRLSKDMASLGFTSVSSPWEVVYYFPPGITGQSQGSSLGSRIIGFCQNTTSVPGLAAGLAAVGCCPCVCHGGGETLAMGMVPMEQQGAARRDAASEVVECGVLLSSRAGRAPGNVSSAHVSSREGRGRKQWDPFQD